VNPSISVPLSNLRAVVIVIVVAFHSVLAYLTSQPAHPFPFDVPPYRWIAFPILDSERWFGFDLFCAWQDISLMSLMFFLAGVFTPRGLTRKRASIYVSERWWRIGVPFLLAAGLLSPLAYFASYRATATDPTVIAFWQHWLALPVWPAGPQWFLWPLFLLGALAALLHAFAPRSLQALSHAAEKYGERTLAFFIGLTALSILAYVPLALAFSPWEWILLGPFSFQLSRPLHYLLYFFAGFAVGYHGIDRGILRIDGSLARHWPAWLAAAVASFAAWGGLTSLTLPDWNASPFVYRLAAASVFPIACAAGVLCLIAISLRLLRMQSRVLESLSSNAYRIYLVHYVLVVWLQYALLAIAFNAVGKAAIVFAGALALSWMVSAGLMAIAPHFDISRIRTIAHQPR
jgi:surface polysaccharide O-acyltransferase-like enzyme